MKWVSKGHFAFFYNRKKIKKSFLLLKIRKGKLKM